MDTDADAPVADSDAVIVAVTAEALEAADLIGGYRAFDVGGGLFDGALNAASRSFFTSLRKLPRNALFIGDATAPGGPSPV